MTDSKKLFLAQALFVTFLWSASKIIIKLGLGLVSPYVLVAAIQLVSFVSLLIYYWVRKPVLRLDLTKSEIYSLILIGIIGFAAAPLFSVIGLKYVTGATAGIFAGLSAVMVMVLGFIILREKPRNLQIAGILIALVGIYIFLSNDALTGSLFGVFMIAIAEAGYALSVVLTRLVVRGPGDETMILSLAGAGIGTVILLPIGLMSGGIAAIMNWQVLLVILIVGVIFGFAGMLWSMALDQIQAIEAAILQNTMLIQIALLSVIFLGEHLTLKQVVGGGVTLIGAYLVERQLINKRKYIESTT